MRLILFLICGLLTSTITLLAQPATVFEHPNVKALTASHKVIAVLPMKVSYDKSALILEDEQVPKDSLVAYAKRDALTCQKSMFHFLMRESGKAGMTVTVQDPDKTNLLMRRQNLTLDTLANFTKDEIAKMLEVDAVLFGEIHTDKILSQEVGLALVYFAGVNAPNNESSGTFMLYEGQKGELIWSFKKDISRGSFTDADALMDLLLKKTAKRFPYFKN